MEKSPRAFRDGGKGGAGGVKKASPIHAKTTKISKQKKTNCKA